jgi:hypothetical protein
MTATVRKILEQALEKIRDEHGLVVTEVKANWITVYSAGLPSGVNLREIDANVKVLS